MLSIRQVAERLGVSYQTARSRIVEALEHAESGIVRVGRTYAVPESAMPELARLASERRGRWGKRGPDRAPRAVHSRNRE